MVNHYCCCIIKMPVNLTNPGGAWVIKLDYFSFPNPEMDSTSSERCKERAKALRKIYSNYEFVQIEPVIIKGIPEEDSK